MWRIVLLLVVALVGQPLVIHPTKAIAIVAGVALLLCAVGVAIRFTPVFVVGVALALAGHTLALTLSASPPRLGAALVAGVVAALTLDVAEFERRFRHVTLGPGVVARQCWYWAKCAATGALAGTALIVVAGAMNSTVRVPWPPVLAVIGAIVALGTVAFAIRRS
jgi:hypothetical protein